MIQSLLLLSPGCVEEVDDVSKEKPRDKVIELPDPLLQGEITVEGAIKNRKSRRRYLNKPLTVHMEAGHAARNIYLQCESMNLGTVTVGAFNDTRVRELLNQIEGDPLYIMPVGKT